MKIRAAITGVNGYVPDFVLSNAVLETMVDTNSEWIETRTGIKERRILKGKGLGNSDMAVEAIKGLLKKKKYFGRRDRYDHRWHCYSRPYFSVHLQHYLR